VKPVNITIERGAAEDGSKVRASAEKIEVHPELFDSLSRDQRDLVCRYPERLDDAAAHDLRLALVAVCVCVGGENVGRFERCKVTAEFRSSGNAAFLVFIAAERASRLPNVRYGIAVSYRVDEPREEINGG